MKTSRQSHAFGKTLVALALAAAFAPAEAQMYQSEPFVQPMTTQPGPVNLPESWIAVGAGWASGDPKDRSRFGMFNGLKDQDVNALIDFQYLKRDAATGSWTTFEGQNLGLDSRQVFFTQRTLGDWKIQAGYSQIVREDPRTINTADTGVGSTTPTINRLATPKTGNDVNLQLKRQAYTLSGDKWITPNIQFEATFKSEDKDGARQWGRGFACSGTWVPSVCASSTTNWALLFLAEPVDSTIRQLDAKVNWWQGNLYLSAGYYGSWYSNNNGNLAASVPGVLNNPLGAPQNIDSGLRAFLSSPMALWPDNEAQQFYVSGYYTFTPTLKTNFKVSYTHATQDNNFLSMGLTGAPTGVTDLGGEVNTTLAQWGATWRPNKEFFLNANLRYEDKDNKTPVVAYNLEGTNSFTNGPLSPKKLNGKVEGTYQLPQGYALTGAVDYEFADHGNFLQSVAYGGISGMQQKSEEWGYRFELRKNLSDQFTGWLSFAHSERSGASPWLKPLSGDGFAEANASPTCVPPPSPAFNNCIYNRTGIFPFIYEDRDRDRYKAMANWQPTDKLSIQGYAEYYRDVYHGPTEHGLRSAAMAQYSLDATYSINDAWKLTAYASYGDSKTRAGHSTGYDAELTDTNTSVGVTLKGWITERLAVGADFLYLHDKLVYFQEVDASGSQTNKDFLAAAGGLPDVTYRLSRLNLFADYSLDKSSSIRMDLTYAQNKFNEWTYQCPASTSPVCSGAPFLFSDNTTLFQKIDQNTTFIGVRYIYRWR